MQIPILIEPVAGGRFRARAGEPFGLSAEGANEQQAIQGLHQLIRDRLRNGARLAVLDVPNGAENLESNANEPVDDLYKDDWFFRELQAEIAKNRRLDEEEEARRNLEEPSSP